MKHIVMGGLLAASCLSTLYMPALAGEFPPPPVVLAASYRPGIDVTAYWVSEKLDGVRGYWDGQRLLTRGGHRIHAPAWFTADWPSSPMDGELWLGRGHFARTSGLVRDSTPDDDAWRQMRFMVFDLPAEDGVFTQRLSVLRARIPALDIPWLVAVEQHRGESTAMLEQRLDAIVAQGGEGLMLRHGDARYLAGRSDHLLKFKRFDDAEARVVAYLPGEGKYDGMLGALVVERPDGVRVRLGTGFSDDQRRDPPPLGSWVTYRFNGLTKNGLPRFARFVAVRTDIQ